MAPALIALDAKAEIAGPKGTRTIPLEKFYVSPEQNLLKENVLSAQEMLVAIEIPAASQGRKGVYLKLKERQAFDFAVVSVAVSVALKGSTVADSRVVFAGLAPYPHQERESRERVEGQGSQECCQRGLCRFGSRRPAAGQECLQNRSDQGNTGRSAEHAKLTVPNPCNCDACRESRQRGATTSTRVVEERNLPGGIFECHSFGGIFDAPHSDQ